MTQIYSKSKNDQVVVKTTANNNKIISTSDGNRVVFPPKHRESFIETMFQIKANGYTLVN